MNANPKFLSADAHVDAAAVAPLPNSRKVYVTGSQPDIRVPMREITQADTPTGFGGEKNPPIYVYDTSGLHRPRREDRHPRRPARAAPTLDRSARRHRSARRPVERLRPRARGRPGHRRPALPGLHRNPRRAQAGKNVTQMHYARQGIITPEMEYIAIRENQRRAEYLENLKASGPNGAKLAAMMGRQHPGQAFGAAAFGANALAEITPEFVRDEVAARPRDHPGNINHPESSR
jgi:phosphomethylpyrimidine synthase